MVHTAFDNNSKIELFFPAVGRDPPVENHWSDSACWINNVFDFIRAQAVVRTQARVLFFPGLLNPEDKFCQLHQSSTFITW